MTTTVQLSNRGDSDTRTNEPIVNLDFNNVYVVQVCEAFKSQLSTPIQLAVIGVGFLAGGAT